MLVNGGPDSLLQLTGQGVLGPGQPAVIAGDPLPVRPAQWAVTDGQRRADNAFGLSTPTSPTPTRRPRRTRPDDPLGGAGGPPRQLLPVPAAGHQTVAVLSGAASVTASSYGSWLAETPQIDPVNAFDDDPDTVWAEATEQRRSASGSRSPSIRPAGACRPASGSACLMTAGPGVASPLTVSTAAGSVTSAVAATGAMQPLSVRPGPTRWLRITIAAARRGCLAARARDSPAWSFPVSR